MERPKLMDINPMIQEALDAVASAKDHLKAAISVAQENCEHQFVSEMEWTSIQPAHRICNHCRLIERGTHWSGRSTWSKHDHSPSDLGNHPARIVFKIGNDTFHKMRIGQ